jgi:hypothetical protein
MIVTCVTLKKYIYDHCRNLLFISVDFYVDLDQKFIGNTFHANFSADLGSQLIPLWVIVCCGFWNPQLTFLRNFLPKTTTNP